MIGKGKFEGNINIRVTEGGAGLGRKMFGLETSVCGRHWAVQGEMARTELEGTAVSWLCDILCPALSTGRR